MCVCVERCWRGVGVEMLAQIVLLAYIHMTYRCWHIGGSRAGSGWGPGGLAHWDATSSAHLSEAQPIANHAERLPLAPSQHSH